MMFFRNTVQMQMLTNTYIHSSLWMYARSPYPYEHLRKSEPMGLDLDGRWERSLPLKEYSKFMRHQSVESQVFPPNHPTTGGRCGRDEPRQEEVHWLKLQLTEPADELCWSKPHKGDERVTGDGGRDNGQEVVRDALVHGLEAHAAIFWSVETHAAWLRTCSCLCFSCMRGYLRVGVFAFSACTYIGRGSRAAYHA